MGAVGFCFLFVFPHKPRRPAKSCRLLRGNIPFANVNISPWILPQGLGRRLLPKLWVLADDFHLITLFMNPISLTI